MEFLRRPLGALAVLLVVLVTGRALAAAPDAMPSATPITSLAGVPCTQPEEISPQSAFAHEITDARTLAFLAYVKDLPARERGDVRKRAAQPVPVAEIDEITRALAAECSFEEVDYRTTRLAFMVARVWSAGEALEIQNAATNALATLLVPDRVSETTRSATLAVFGTSAQRLDEAIAASASPPSAEAARGVASDPCASIISARSSDPTQPYYPPFANANNIGGTIAVLVDLDEHGYVKSASLYTSKLDPPDQSGADLITQTIISATTTHYTPEFDHCVPHGGRYIFRADYLRR